MAQRNEGRILDFLYEEARCAVIPIPIWLGSSSSSPALFTAADQVSSWAPWQESWEVRWPAAARTSRPAQPRSRRSSRCGQTQSWTCAQRSRLSPLAAVWWHGGGFLRSHRRGSLGGDTQPAGAATLLAEGMGMGCSSELAPRRRRRSRELIAPSMGPSLDG
jgi:hypothetical protein